MNSFSYVEDVFDKIEIVRKSDERERLRFDFLNFIKDKLKFYLTFFSKCLYAN